MVVMSMKLLKILFTVAVLSPGLFHNATATEPLLDAIDIGDEHGIFMPDQCCWIKLPETQRLRDAKRAQRCTAVGGPVGRFRLEGDKLFLVGLRQCSGDVPLHDIYPDLTDPAPASWLNGTFHVLSIDHGCRPGRGANTPRETITLSVKDGIVTSMNRRFNENEQCSRSP